MTWQHGVFTTDTQTRLVGRWRFIGVRFQFKANGSRTYLKGFYFPWSRQLVVGGLSRTRFVGKFTAGRG
jgi:hypothetical protein